MNEAERPPAAKRPIFDASKFPLGDAKILPDYTQLKTPDEIDNMSHLIDGSPAREVVPNPFYYRIHLTRADKIKVALMSVVLVPVRIVFIVFFLLLTWLGCYLGQLGLSDKDRAEKPLTGFRRDYLKPFLAFFLRLMFESGGLTYSFKGKLASQKEAPVLVVGPHSSLLDGVVVLLLGGLTPVAKAGSEDVPIFGTILNFTQPVYVKRSDPNSRQNTVREIIRRATSKDPWSQVIIFPEGTCTNRTCLISFKLGAFVPGVPVQPVLIRYPNELNTLIWTWDGPSALQTLWLTLCQLKTHMEIEYLPVYVPSEREKEDPKLYAENVRCLMAKALRIPLSSYSYDDLKHVEMDDGGFAKTVACTRLQHLISRNRVQFRDLDDVLLRVKAAIKSRESSKVSFSEFVAILGLPSDRASKDVFDVLNVDGSKQVELRAFLAALWLVHKTETNRTEHAFKVFCDGSDEIILEDFVQLIWILLELPKSAASSMFQKIDSASLGRISFADFKEFISTTKWAEVLGTPMDKSASQDTEDNSVPSKED